MRLGRNHWKHRARRVGGISTYVLVTIPLLLMAGMVAINAAWMVEAKTGLQGGTEAAALAAGGALADDDYLRGDDESIDRLVRRARDEAQFYAWRNPTLAEPLNLQRNDENEPDGDIVLGSWSRQQGFKSAKWHNGKCEDSGKLDAIKICGRRLCKRGEPIRLLGGFFCRRDAEACSIAHLDGCVIGFRQCFDHSIPMCPIALRSCRDGSDDRSWEHQCRDKHGSDDWEFDCEKKSCHRKADGIHEMCGRFAKDKDEDQKNEDDEKKDGNKDGSGRGKRRGNMCLLQLGATSCDSFRRQIVEGLTSEDLRDYDGELRLRDDRTLPVRGRWWEPERNSDLNAAMLSGLEELRRSGSARVWPLYSRVDGNDEVLLSGFVAARVASLEFDSEDGSLRLLLQPTRLVTRTAICQSDRDRHAEHDEVNRYVVKLRLVE